MIFGARAQLINPKPQTGNSSPLARNNTSGGQCLTCLLALGFFLAESQISPGHVRVFLGNQSGLTHHSITRHSQNQGVGLQIYEACRRLFEDGRNFCIKKLCSE
jgi:hypothetical protein